MDKEALSQPCERALWYVIPYIRASLARKLDKVGLNQEKIADKLDISQAAVSQYINGKRGKGQIEDLGKEAQDSLNQLAHGLYEGDIDNLGRRICSICNKVDTDKIHSNHAARERSEETDESLSVR